MVVCALLLCPAEQLTPSEPAGIFFGFTPQATSTLRAMPYSMNLLVGYRPVIFETSRKIEIATHGPQEGTIAPPLHSAGKQTKMGKDPAVTGPVPSLEAHL